MHIKNAIMCAQHVIQGMRMNHKIFARFDYHRASGLASSKRP